MGLACPSTSAKIIHKNIKIRLFFSSNPLQSSFFLFQSPIPQHPNPEHESRLHLLTDAPQQRPNAGLLVETNLKRKRVFSPLRPRNIATTARVPSQQGRTVARTGRRKTKLYDLHGVLKFHAFSATSKIFQAWAANV